MAHVDSISYVDGPGAPLVATACAGAAHLWEVTSGTEVALPPGHDAYTRVVALGVVAGRALLACGGDGGDVTVWDPYAGRLVASITLDSGIGGAWFVRGEPLLAVLTQADGALHLLELVDPARAVGDDG